MASQATSNNASDGIVGNVRIEGRPTPYYGEIVANDIKYIGGYPVTIRDFFVIKFISPKVSSPIRIDASFVPSFEQKIYTKDLDTKTISVTAYFIPNEVHILKPEDTLVFEINGDLTDKPDIYTKSFEFFLSDRLPSGTININSAPAPAQELAKSVQTVRFKQGDQAASLSLLPGEAIFNSFPLVSGEYTVTADELTNAAETIATTALVSPSQVLVETGKTTSIQLTYKSVSKYCTLRVALGKLHFDKNELIINVVELRRGVSLASFYSSSEHTTDLRRLPESGIAFITAEITILRIRYFARKTVFLENKVVEVTFEEKDFNN